MEKLILNIESGLLMKALYNGDKLVAAAGTFVKYEEIELNHVVIHFKDKDRYYECVQCIGAQAELKEVK